MIKYAYVYGIAIILGIWISLTISAQMEHKIKQYREMAQFTQHQFCSDSTWQMNNTNQLLPENEICQ